MKIELEIPEGYPLSSFTLIPIPVKPFTWGPVPPPLYPNPCVPPFGGGTFCSNGPEIRTLSDQSGKNEAR
jgi:hypothetical protein